MSQVYREKIANNISRSIYLTFSAKIRNINMLSLLSPTSRIEKCIPRKNVEKIAERFPELMKERICTNIFCAVRNINQSISVEINQSIEHALPRYFARL